MLTQNLDLGTRWPACGRNRAGVKHVHDDADDGTLSASDGTLGSSNGAPCADGGTLGAAIGARGAPDGRLDGSLPDVLFSARWDHPTVQEHTVQHAGEALECSGCRIESCCAPTRENGKLTPNAFGP